MLGQPNDLQRRTFFVLVDPMSEISEWNERDNFGTTA